MEPKTTFKKNGYDYKLLEWHPTGKFAGVAIYAQIRPGVSLTMYETQILRYSPPRDTEIGSFPEGFKYPSDEDFGKYGWSYANLALAQAKAQQVLQKTLKIF